MTGRIVVPTIALALLLMPGAPVPAHADTRTITGVLTDSRDGRPAAGLRVRAFDEDDLNEHDLMGDVMSDVNGSYTITYNVRNWDTRTVFKPSARHPDIFVQVDLMCAGATNSFGTLARSSVHGNNHDATLRIDLQVDQQERGNLCGPSVCCRPRGGIFGFFRHCEGTCATGGSCRCSATAHSRAGGDTACACQIEA